MLYPEWIENDQPSEVSSQMTHALALLSVRLPESLVSSAERALLRTDVLAPELYMHHVVLRALVRSSRAADAGELIRKY